MPDLKHEISPALVRALAWELARAWPDFPAAGFAAEASAGLGRLELMDRVRHVAAVLGRRLPDPFERAAEVLDRALESPTFDSWMTLPCTLCVVEIGLDEPELALPLLARLSPRFSSELAVRPFIERDPEVAFAHMRRFAGDRDEHVRRLASEGTRPRLPWASRLTASIDDPVRGLALLELLYDDPSEYVRRSVANHLGDVAKDHRELALSTAARWLRDGGEAARPTVEHALRTLVKRGDPDALRLLGFDPDAAVRLERLTLTPTRVAVGGRVEVAFTLIADGRPAPVAVDLRVTYAGARGPRSPKVFKLATLTLDPGEPRRITGRHAFRELSIRRLHPGPQRIELQVNGRVLGGGEVELLAPGATARSTAARP